MHEIGVCSLIEKTTTVDGGFMSGLRRRVALRCPTGFLEGEEMPYEAGPDEEGDEFHLFDAASKIFL